jgi:hypothetical protein
MQAAAQYQPPPLLPIAGESEFVSARWQNRTFLGPSSAIARTFGVPNSECLRYVGNDEIVALSRSQLLQATGGLIDDASVAAAGHARDLWLGISVNGLVTLCMGVPGGVLALPGGATGFRAALLAAVRQALLLTPLFRQASLPAAVELSALLLQWPDISHLLQHASQAVRAAATGAEEVMISESGLLAALFPGGGATQAGGKLSSLAAEVVRLGSGAPGSRNRVMVCAHTGFELPDAERATPNQAWHYTAGAVNLIFTGIAGQPRLQPLLVQFCAKLMNKSVITLATRVERRQQLQLLPLVPWRSCWLR